MSTKRFKIPKEVTHVTELLEKAGFEAYLVGGCVRDLLRKEEPRDWDITTNAKPEDITDLFENTYYNNDYGTVSVVNDDAEGKSYHVIEITPYRLESNYSDSRRPDNVVFSGNIEDDLKRRDFTINAIAYNPTNEKIIDPYGGQEDLFSRTIHAVGIAEDRFNEDALRVLRAIRLAAELGFLIHPDTEQAIKKTAQNLAKIAKERIRDEFTRILMSKRPMEGLLLAEKLSVLEFVLPELKRGIDIKQNQAHKYDVYEHNLKTLKHAADKNWSFEIRLAALLHDISKPETRRWSDEKKDYTFHGHDVVGSRVSKKILTDLKFPNKTIDKVTTLIRWHMFFSDPEKITLSAVRRTIRNVGGEENMWDLLNLRICDRIGTGRPKEQPFRLRKYTSMVEETLRDPLSVTMLNINGGRVMEIIDEKPGPKVGYILHALLEEVLDDPKKNNSEYLEGQVKKLSTLSMDKLKKIGESGKIKKDKAEEKEIKDIRDKYWVK
ncbi:CCA tRNA nucleotidyltransferase [Patescibacteria group bacterium]|nr:CCA tRNA nucleotidyltransferase [Patescibacteria group bacterium]